jgi:hypothetical protein
LRRARLEVGFREGAAEGRGVLRGGEGGAAGNAAGDIRKEQGREPECEVFRRLTMRFRRVPGRVCLVSGREHKLLDRVGW